MNIRHKKSGIDTKHILRFCIRIELGHSPSPITKLQNRISQAKKKRVFIPREIGMRRYGSRRRSSENDITKTGFYNPRRPLRNGPLHPAAIEGRRNTCDRKRTSVPKPGRNAQRKKNNSCDFSLLHLKVVLIMPN
ncbi:hypothetical protein AVEN_89162-1 [Araneus ventricosus]|uniref:Uncharacterized protein n=1 Tax=Araneus ventricosus TaxID=182803 RepID=A0A4Y2B4B8_ARAVE|nr:hypothetical protein AVEN_89162-1 [Araneus ventricosus]